MGGDDRGGRRAWVPAARSVALLFILVVVVASAGAAWSLQRKGENSATAVVMLHPLTGNAYSPGGRGDELVNLETEAQVLRSEAVARAVLDRLDSAGDSADLLAVVQVSVPPNTQLLEITTTGPDAETALARVSAFAEVYLAFRRARTESAVFEQTSRLDELVDARADERTAAIDKLERLTSGSSQRPVLEQQIEELTLQISSLRAQLVTAESESLDPGQVVRPGRVNAPGLLHQPALVGASAGLAVLLVAGGWVGVRSGRVRTFTIRSLDDLTDLPPPAFGAVRAPVRPDDGVVAAVRSSVLAVAPARPRVVAVARADRASSVLHRSLVTSLGNARYQVVSVDLGRPEDVAAVAQLVLEEVEVDEVLSDQQHFVTRLQPTAVDRERTESELADLVTAAGMARSLHDLAKRADVVVVRCPGLTTPVGRAVLTAASAVVVEVSPFHTTRNDVERALEEADRGDCDVLGLVEVRGIGVGTSEGEPDAQR
ncbi:hypothetical protein [Nocardioides sp. Root190]|uniref:hypothetical protein n=1 Tax=Nocardioides sp. Root190 TaxID=1736488 RepID=UPI000A6BEBCD|nr:hypothetical protein [Nocardioides sp. Root190]